MNAVSECPLPYQAIVSDIPDMQQVFDFVAAFTSSSWLQAAANNLHLIMQDHANCEKKAASTALNLMFKYGNHTQLQKKLAQLVREEMLHYEQVLSIMQQHNLPWINVSASRYAQGLRQHIRTFEPAAFVDIMIIGAFVEARSCERFAALIPYVEPALGKYYRYLLKSEARHFSDYLSLASSMSPEDISPRIQFFREIERALIESPDQQLHFHSGIPADDRNWHNLPA